MRLGQRLRKFLRDRGFDIVRYSYNSHPLARRARLIASYNITTVLDVGANAGYYAKQLREIGFKGRIISFEPLGSAYKELSENAKSDPLWETLNFALGSEGGQVEINIATNSLSSSILGILPSHVDFAPESYYVGKEKIIVKRLDSIFEKVCRNDEKVYLKIDTQGFEKKVIEGAGKVLHYIDTVQLEMSLVPLYEDELLFIEMMDLLNQKGYKLVAIEPGFSDPLTGQLLQVDGIFHRF